MMVCIFRHKYIEVQGMFHHASAVLVTYILYTYI